MRIQHMVLLLCSVGALALGRSATAADAVPVIALVESVTMPGDPPSPLVAVRILEVDIADPALPAPTIDERLAFTVDHAEYEAFWRHAADQAYRLELQPDGDEWTLAQLGERVTAADIPATDLNHGDEEAMARRLLEAFAADDPISDEDDAPADDPAPVHTVTDGDRSRLLDEIMHLRQEVDALDAVVGGDDERAARRERLVDEILGVQDQLADLEAQLATAADPAMGDLARSSEAMIDADANLEQRALQRDLQRLADADPGSSAVAAQPLRRLAERFDAAARRRVADRELEAEVDAILAEDLVPELNPAEQDRVRDMFRSAPPNSTVQTTLAEDEVVVARMRVLYRGAMTLVAYEGLVRPGPAEVDGVAVRVEAADGRFAAIVGEATWQVGALLTLRQEAADTP